MDPVETDHAAQQHSEDQSMGAAISKEASIAKLVEETEDPPEISSRDWQDGSGQVSAEISAGTINELALKKGAGSSSALRKKTTFPKSPPQSLGKRKRQLAKDTPVPPSKRITRGRGRLEQDHGDTVARRQGKLARVRGKSTNNQSQVKSGKDIYEVENMSPQVDQDQTEARKGKRAAKSSSPVHTAGSGAEQENAITTDATFDHVSDTNPRIPHRRVATLLPSKPKGRPKKQQRPAQSSTSKSKSTMSRNHNLRSINHSNGGKSRNVSKAPEHDPSKNGQATSSDQGVRPSSNESTVQRGHHDDDDGPEGDNVDELEATDDNDYIEWTEANDQRQVESTTRFLLRGPEWDKVMEGAHTVGFSSNAKIPKEGKPHLETRTIKAFVKQVRKTSKLYQVSGRRGQVEPEVQEVERQVELIDEDQAGNKKCEMVQDIYAHAIPELVFMLDKALYAREADCSLSDHVKGLKEIIRLQDVVIQLCEKARDWTVDPIMDRPIKKSTTQKIFPCLRSMRQTLQKELDDRQKNILRRKDEAAAELERERMEDDMWRKEMEDERERLAIWENINKQLDRNERVLFPRKPPRPPRAIPPLGIDDWTVEQELVLNKYLEEFGDLPGER